MTPKKMKNITIAIPEIFVENLKKLQDAGIVPSRSEAIRTAIREFLKGESKIVSLFGYNLTKKEKKGRKVRENVLKVSETMSMLSKAKIGKEITIDCDVKKLKKSIVGLFQVREEIKNDKVNTLILDLDYLIHKINGKGIIDLSKEDFKKRRTKIAQLYFEILTENFGFSLEETELNI